MCAKHTSRRGFLGTVGAIGATVGLPAVVGKQDELTFEEKIERANRVRQEHNSRDAWKEYLLDRGVTGSSDQYTLGGDDGPSIQRYHDESEIDVEINLTFDVELRENQRKYYGELNWQFHWGGKEVEKWCPDNQCRAKAKSRGEPPRDIVGIGFSKDHWDTQVRNIYSYTNASNHVEVEKESVTGRGENGGVAFAMHDQAANEGGGYEDDGQKFYTIPPSETFFCGIFLEPVGEYTESQRWIQGDYHHIWGGLGIDSVSIGAGISTSLEFSTEEMKIATNNDNCELELRQDEATWESRR